MTGIRSRAGVGVLVGTVLVVVQVVASSSTRNTGKGRNFRTHGSFALRPLVVELDVPKEEPVSRLAHRSSYSARTDDAGATVENRPALYRRNAADLVSYFRQKGVLITINGGGATDDVTLRIRNQLDCVFQGPDQT